MYKYPLMRNNFSRSDLDAVIEYLKQDDPILTNGPLCKQFETEWSQWLGVKNSLFVNSGTSANILSMAVLKLLNPSGGEILVPSLTWVSDVASVLQAGFKPVFVDINPKTLCMDTDEITKKTTDQTRAVFLTHAQGFNGLTDRLLNFLEDKNIPLIEDVCESHGATHKKNKLGSYGFMSNFSFYYAHHMSTIEGGMVCSNNEQVHEKLRMLRSHGMVREANLDETKLHYYQKFPDLNPQFIFAHAGFNMRNNELGAILGIEQLKRLDENNEIRSNNQARFLKGINSEHFRVDFFTKGSSNYAFNLILKRPDKSLMQNLKNILDVEGVEFRQGSAGGGNMTRQPFLQKLLGADAWRQFPETEHVHHFGMYIGNFPQLGLSEVDQIVEIVNSAAE